jgi:hypothetical protein
MWVDKCISIRPVFGEGKLNRPIIFHSFLNEEFYNERNDLMHGNFAKRNMHGENQNNYKLKTNKNWKYKKEHPSTPSLLSVALRKRIRSRQDEIGKE